MMNIGFKNWCSLILVLVLFPLQGMAYAEVQSQLMLDEIVVTATKSNKSILNAPVNVSVVKSEDIEQSTAITVDEAIQYMPGSFHWKRTGMTEPHPFILMRGFRSSSRNLALIDGMTLNYPPYQSINWMSVPLLIVDRIEQARGPFSSLYGGSAMGGVTNIISKTPEKKEVKVKASYGSNQSMVAQLGYGDKFADKYSLMLAYEGRKTDGYPSRFPTKAGSSGSAGTPVSGWDMTRDVKDTKNLYILGDRGDENNEENLFYAKFGVDLTPRSNLNFSINHYEKDFERGDYNSWLRDTSGNIVDTGTVNILGQDTTVSPGTFLMGTGNSSRRQTRYIARYTNTFTNGFSLEAMAGLTDTPKSISNTPTTSATNSGGEGRISETESKAYVGEVKGTVNFGERQLITAGISFEKNSSENTYHSLSNWKDTDSKTDFQRASGGETQNWGVYLQDEIQLHEQVTAYVGGRFDYYKVSDGFVTLTDPEYSVTRYESNSESQFSPKLSLHYRPFEATVLRGSVGTSFRGPLISELYKKTFHNPNIWMYGNPELEPEKATSWEMGVVQSLFNRKSHISMTYFESYVDDLINSVPIAYDPVSGTATETQSQNIGKAEIKGIEVEAQHRFTPYLSAFANFTWTEAITKEHPTNKQYEGKQLTLIPEYMCNLGLKFSMNRFDASANAKYRSKIYGRSDNLDVAENVPRAYDEIWMLDLKVGYTFNEHLKVSLAVNDLFDENPYYNYLSPGRTFLGTVEFSF